MLISLFITSFYNSFICLVQLLRRLFFVFLMNLFFSSLGLCLLKYDLKLLAKSHYKSHTFIVY